MRNLVLLIFIFILSFGCIADKSQLAINFKNKKQHVTGAPSVTSASVSSVQVVNNQLVITGNGLNAVTNIKVGGTSFNESFTIESKTATTIIANSVRAFSFDVSKLFNLIISDASASATFPIDFSLCNSTLNGKGFNCSTPIADKDVLSYDAVSGTWKPRPASGLNYLGTFDASTNPGSGPAIKPAGAYYVISDDGAIAAVSFAVGDWLVSNGTSWQKIDNSSAVLSVHGRFGAITAQHGDYFLHHLGDVSFPVAPVAGKVLKFDGTSWVAGDDLSGGGAGSVTTTAIADGAVTDAKIDTLAASKITGTITSAQIADGVIVNADVSAGAAIDYSKLNVPNGAIAYAKLNIADGTIPAAKISGLPVLSSILAATISDGDTTHAPTGEAVYEALQTKLGTSGGTLLVGTISGVPAPVNPSDIVNKSYVDNAISGVSGLTTTDIPEGSSLYFTEVRVLATDLAGLNTGVNGPIVAADTVLGAFGKMQYQVTDLKAKGQWDKTVNDISYSAGNVSIDKKLRLKSDNANYVEILSPTALASTYTLTLPGNDGSANQVLKTDGAGVLAWVDVNDANVQAFAKSALPSCAAGEVLKSNGTIFSCVTDNAGAAAFSGTASRAVVTTAGGVLGVSATTSAELGFVSGVTSGIQAQINSKQAALGFTPIDKAGDSITAGNFVFSGTATLRAPDPVVATDVVNKQYFETFGQWSKNGSDIYRSSNVGIGISNPTYKLQVQDGKIYTTGASGYYQVGLDTSDNNLGKISFHNTSQTTAGRYWTGLAYSNSNGSLSIGGGDSLNLQLDSGNSASYGNHVFRKVGWDGTNRTFTESMRIDKDGNVGIGTNAPKSKLDVNGAIRVGVDATTCSATISGAMRFNTPNVEYCNGTSWIAFAASNAAVASSQITDGTIVDIDVSAAANITVSKLGTGVVDNAEFNYLDGVTSSIQTQLNGKQALDATLTALAGYSTNGILVQTGVDTFAGRAIAGTANRVTVTNGNGVSGNPTLDIPTALLPSPVGGDVGKFLKATAANTSVWTALGLSDVTTALGYTPIDKAGDTLTTGTFTLSGAAVLRTPDPVAGTDVANKQYVDSYGLWTKNGSDIGRAGGYVGIGTIAPISGLTVQGTGGSNDDVYIDSYADTGEGALMIRRARNLSSAPATLLASDRIGFLSFRGYNGAGYSDLARVQAIAETDLNVAASASLQMYTTNAGSNTEKMRITAAGKVGINNSSPQGRLHVIGSIYDKNPTATNAFGMSDMIIQGSGTTKSLTKGTGLSFALPANNDGSNIWEMARVFVTPDFTADSSAAGSMHLQTRYNNGVDWSWRNSLTITSNGLTTAEGTGGGVFSIRSTATAVDHAYFQIFADANNPNTRSGWLGFGVAGTTNMSIHNEMAGNLTLGTGGSQLFTLFPTGNATLTGTLTQSSDRRLKKDITDLKYGLNEVLKLEPKSYVLISSGEESLGFIAQDVEAIMPELVKTNDNGFKSLAYTLMPAVIVNAIKEQHLLIEKNLELMAVMEGRLNRIENEIQNQQRKIASLDEKMQEKDSRIKKLEDENLMMKAYLCRKDPVAPFCLKK